MRRFNGYTEAQKIDKMLSKLIGAHPVNSSNWSEWSKLTRTLGSSLMLINAKIKQHMENP